VEGVKRLRRQMRQRKCNNTLEGRLTLQELPGKTICKTKELIKSWNECEIVQNMYMYVNSQILVGLSKYPADRLDKPLSKKRKFHFQVSRIRKLCKHISGSHLREEGRRIYISLK
jgi:hypothetical protein